jgi:sec-independent protein translocase protein TatC
VAKPTTFGVAEPFLTVLKISMFGGLLLAAPVILWQLWSFFAPAIDDQQNRRIRLFVLFAAALLVSGIFFGYFVTLPAAVHYLTNFDKEQFNIQLRAKDYYSFTTMVILAMAVVFQLPIFVLALVRLGILSTRQLRRNRRIGYFIVVVVAVALPGIDPFTTALESLPLLVLFELSIWLSVLVERRQPAPQEALL